MCRGHFTHVLRWLDRDTQHQRQEQEVMGENIQSDNHKSKVCSWPYGSHDLNVLCLHWNELSLLETEGIVGPPSYQGFSGCTSRAHTETSEPWRERVEPWAPPCFTQSNPSVVYLMWCNSMGDCKWMKGSNAYKHTRREREKFEKLQIELMLEFLIALSSCSEINLCLKIYVCRQWKCSLPWREFPSCCTSIMRNLLLTCGKFFCYYCCFPPVNLPSASSSSKH